MISCKKVNLLPVEVHKISDGLMVESTEVYKSNVSKTYLMNVMQYPMRWGTKPILVQRSKKNLMIDDLIDLLQGKFVRRKFTNWKEIEWLLIMHEFWPEPGGIRRTFIDLHSRLKLEFSAGSDEGTRSHMISKGDDMPPNLTSAEVTVAASNMKAKVSWPHRDRMDRNKEGHRKRYGSGAGPSRSHISVPPITECPPSDCTIIHELHGEETQRNAAVFAQVQAQVLAKRAEDSRSGELGQNDSTEIQKKTKMSDEHDGGALQDQGATPDEEVHSEATSHGAAGQLTTDRRERPRLSEAMNLLCWNCWGVGQPRIVQDLVRLVHAFHPKIVFLSETRQRKETVEGLRWRIGLKNVLSFSEKGKGGGLALFWDESLDVQLLGMSGRVIDVMINDLPKGIKWRCTFVYGEPRTHQRHG